MRKWIIVVGLFIVAGFTLKILGDYWNYKRLQTSLNEYEDRVIDLNLTDLMFFNEPIDLTIEELIKSAEIDIIARDDIRMIYDTLSESIIIYSIGFDNVDDDLSIIFEGKNVDFFNHYTIKGDIVLGIYKRNKFPKGNLFKDGRVIWNEEIVTDIKRDILNINKIFYRNKFNIELGKDAILSPDCAMPLGILLSIRDKTVEVCESEVEIPDMLKSEYLEYIQISNLDSIDKIFLDIPIATKSNCFIEL